MGFERSARITIPDIHEIITAHTESRITSKDFVPSPLAHPHCYSICYILCLDDGGYVPYTRLVGRTKLYEMLGESLYIEPRAEVEQIFLDIIDDLWSDPDKLEESESVLRTLKRLIREMFPSSGKVLPMAQRRKIVERSSKAIYIHSHMDEENFDVSRIMKCCVGVPSPDGTNIPTCSYNVLYREKDGRFADPAMLSRMKKTRPKTKKEQRHE